MCVHVCMCGCTCVHMSGGLRLTSLFHDCFPLHSLKEGLSNKAGALYYRLLWLIIFLWDRLSPLSEGWITGGLPYPPSILMGSVDLNTRSVMLVHSPDLSPQSHRFKVPKRKKKEVQVYLRNWRQGWEHTAFLHTLSRWRQEDWKFKVNLDHTERSRPVFVTLQLVLQKQIQNQQQIPKPKTTKVVGLRKGQPQESCKELQKIAMGGWLQKAEEDDPPQSL